MRYSDVIKITFDSTEKEYALYNFLDDKKYEYNVYYPLPEEIEEMIARSSRALDFNIEYRDVLHQGGGIEEHIYTIKKYLFKNETDRLIIFDKYFFPLKYDEDYIPLIISILSECNAKEIVFVVSKKYNKELYEQVISELGNKFSYSLFFSEDYHDRFWIYPSNVYGFIIGTSLNGIGKRISLVQKMSHIDVIDVIRTLPNEHQIGKDND